MYIIAEKPNRIFDEKKDKEKVDPKVQEMEDKLKAKIIESTLTPKMKYKHPVTASQEIGWINAQVRDC